MPKTDKSKKIMKKMKDTYGPDKGEKVFYASKNKGKSMYANGGLVKSTGKLDTGIKSCGHGK